MTYDLTTHRESVRSWCLTLVTTPGFADYAIAKADAMVKDDPTLHGDLARAVRAAAPTSTPRGPARTSRRSP